MTEKIESAKARYLSRKGYESVAGNFVFAKHGKTAKAVCFFDGQFGRSAFKQITAEAAALGLDKLTILVNGLITYSGSGWEAIRVDQGYPQAFIDDEIEADFMSDVRAGRSDANHADVRRNPSALSFPTLNWR